MDTNVACAIIAVISTIIWALLLVGLKYFPEQTRKALSVLKVTKIGGGLSIISRKKGSSTNQTEGGKKPGPIFHIDENPVPLMRCPHCRALNEKSVEQCGECGYYFVINPDQRMKCPQCGTITGKDAVSCPQCHYEFVITPKKKKIRCPVCQNLLKADAELCLKCGNVIVQPPPPQNGITCTRCNTFNVSSSKFCKKCAHPLLINPPQVSNKQDSKEEQSSIVTGADSIHINWG